MINPLRAYTKYIEEKDYSDNNANNLPDIQKPKINKEELSLKNPNELLSSKEREFFVKLFPESSDQIEKHILFNKNGKLQSVPISKGMIVDGRV